MKETSKCSIYFKYLCGDVIYDKVGIVGGLDTLKNWDINNPVFLNFNEKDKIFISSQIDLPMNEIIEYKYVFHHKDEKIWENLPNNANRKIEIKLNVPQIILDKEGDPNSIIETSNILREQKKKSKLMARESKLEMDIEQLQKEIELKEKELIKKENDDKEKRQANNEDHQEDCKNISADCQQKLDTIREKLTTAKK